MGVVYMADQKEPVKRRVALKIIKPGMDTQQVIARFEAERQALALMDHPNIARVLDAGGTDKARRKGTKAAAAVVKQQADEAYVDLREFFAALRPAFSYQQIADILNMRGERTRRGKPWTDVAVLRACARLGIELP
jgi:serine/threonine protein kinase